MLYEPGAVREERPVDGRIARRRARKALERSRVPLVP
jgi:hypothetical protein